MVEKLLLETTNVETYLKPAKTIGHTSKAACHACEGCQDMRKACQLVYF